MPVVFRHRNVRFHFFSNEGAPREPVQIHAESRDGEAKPWLYPEVRVARSVGYSRRQLLELAGQRRNKIERAWNERFGSVVEQDPGAPHLVVAEKTASHLVGRPVVDFVAQQFPRSRGQSGHHVEGKGEPGVFNRTQPSKAPGQRYGPPPGAVGVGSAGVQVIPRPSS